MNKKDLAKYIDQTLLSACATEEEIIDFCQNAKENGFASVCINLNFVPVAYKILKDSDVKVCTVIDFPLGAGGIESKLSQADIAITQGAEELDFVVNLALVKSHKWDELFTELFMITKSVKEASMFFGSDESSFNVKVVTKLILETCYLSDDEIKETCLCAKKAGFDFVKTSTGFANLKNGEITGATEHHVKLMRETAGSQMGVKASGGISDYETALKMIEAGASRIGTSKGLKILETCE